MSSKSNSAAIKRRTSGGQSAKPNIQTTQQNSDEPSQIHIFDIVAEHHRQIHNYETRICNLEQLVRELTTNHTNDTNSQQSVENTDSIGV